ncbi:hypothetical protein Q8A67_002770 [Cirrhinus molitorella]|uniref:Uncharacterized protein n=1 Tax=Cirrhinus molitorella TaxID=172907 RepID=A0AA88Q701_9TELE|nr:hypothetical protein Q8A67_002770 [Cirrhinus molitorella]
MAHSSIATSIPLTCKLCPNNLLPDDGHEICPSCLGVQHLREALTDPCLHCSLLPMSERRLRLAELDPNSAVKLGQLEVTPPRSMKRRTSAAAGAPIPSKRKATSQSSGPPKRRSKIARTLASMAEADSSGMGRAPEIEQPVAAMVVSPNQLPGGPRQRPPTTTKGRIHKV